jgi:two-component system CheB/CheR fusion protein
MQERQMGKEPGQAAEQLDTQPPPESFAESTLSLDTSGEKPGYIVAIGGSAGGFEAFERFFSGIPPDSGMAFVVIQHLDPNHESLLSELLQRSTSMPVREATDGMPVARNVVYVIPQNTELSIHDGRLQISELSVARGVRMPVDLFFESLAVEQGEKSIGIIVSGMGTDGTLGLKAIKEVSGVVMVQDPDTAKFDGMPRSAIATGQVDYVAQIDDLPKRLIAYVKHFAQLQDVKDEKAPKGELQKILQLLKTRTKHDFTLYKKSTLYRRIAKRASLLQIDGIPEYARYIEAHTDELDILFREFLIGVTRFFRDLEAFDYLENNVLPELIGAAAQDGAFRVWVAGCSTGEEAYSIAIVLREVIERLRPDAGLQLQIFATDIDDRAISVARKGFYPHNIASDVSAERLDRFFSQVEDGYQINKSIRETVIFALHDLVNDPPFTKMDLVSCRNMMIYFSPELQKKIMPILHYALNPGGILFLGTAESTAGAPNFFLTVDSKWKIYRRNETKTLPTRLVDVPANQPLIEKHEAENLPNQPGAPVSETVKRVLLERYAPPSVIVDANGNIVYISGHTGKYLEPAEGSANWNICAMAREGLKLELPSAIYRAFRQKTDVTLKELKIKTNCDYETVNVTISPFTRPDSMSGLLMVVFEDVVLPETPVIVNAADEPPGEPNEKLARIEKELALTKDHLQRIVEEMQATQEELRSANEELQSTNEELQSTNEELITSKEELQSLNEELVTLNNELQTRIDDLTALNNDMINLMNSTQVATIFLDLKRFVRRFTPAVVGLFNLRAVDIGRPITDITQNLRYETIDEDLSDVLHTLTAMERQIQSNDGRWFIMRIMPYRTLDGLIEGVAVTFSDVTPLKQLESELKTSEALSHALNEISAEISASLDSEPALAAVVKKASEAIGVGAGMITARENDRWIVRQVFGLQHLDPGTQIKDEDVPFLKLVEQAGEPLAIQDISADSRVSFGAAQNYGMRSVLGVQLVAGGKFVGVLSLIGTSGSTVFTDAVIDFAYKLGTAVSLALNNIRLYNAELKAKIDAEDARQVLQEHHNMLQQALLPAEMYATTGYLLATRFIPGAAGKYIGGDFYDVFETEDGKTALLIGDVTGKGVEAASLAVAVRSTIRAFAYDLGRPDQALTHANAVTYSQSLFSERFATVFLAILDPQTGQFSHASAGHPPSMVLRADGRVELLSTGQVPIGIDGQTEYKSSESQLHAGDRLVMYTDGISESHKGPTMYGEEGIQATLEQCGRCMPEKLLDELFRAATDIVADKLVDDAVVVIIERDAEA